jgi:hypothetical protein
MKKRFDDIDTWAVLSCSSAETTKKYFNFLSIYFIENLLSSDLSNCSILE